MNWLKLKKQHYFKEPVEFIYTSELFDRLEYDTLYENLNDLSHKVWQEFDEKYKLPFQLYQDIRDINTNKEVICLWFFRDRNDQSKGNDIVIAGKTITYFHNTFLITECKDIKIRENNKRQYIHRPFIQIDLSKKTYQELVKKIK